MNRVLITSLLFSFLFSCQKDLVPNETDQSNNSLIDRAKTYHDSISNFKPNLLSIDTGDIFAYLELDWNSSVIEYSNNGASHVKVPVIIDPCPYQDSVEADYIFYDDSCGLTSEIWFYGYDNTYIGTRKDSIEDGWVIVMNSCHWTSQVFVIENGTVLLHDTIEIVPNESNSGTTGLNKIDPRKYKPKKIKCPTFDGNGGGGGIFGWIGNIFSNIGDFFGKIFSGGKKKKGGSGGSGSGGSGGGGSGGGWSGGGWSGHGGWWSGSTGSWGSGGSPPGPNWSEEEGIDYNRFITADKILYCLEENDGTFSSIKQILLNIIGNCKSIPVGDIDNLARQLMRQDESTWLLTLRSFLIYQDVSEHCLKTIYDADNCINTAQPEFVSDQLEFLEDYGLLGMDEDEFIAFIRENGCYKLHGIEFKKCLLRAKLESICPQITESLMNKILNFLIQYPEGFENFNEAYCMTEEEWDNYLDLLEQFENNPTLLLDCAGQSDHSPFWDDLANFTPGQDVLDELQSRDPAAYLQLINQAGGPVVNFDYFGVKINTLPPGMNQNELFESIRKEFAETNIIGGNACNSTMSYAQVGTDKPLWHSSSPKNSLFYFDIPADNGVVICSDFNSSCCWTFTTVFTKINNAGEHPVSGNRQFGIFNNGAGYTFYTRAADRQTTNYFLFNGLSQKLTFNGADDLWECTFEQIKEYIESLGGTCDGEIEQDAWRPNYNDIKSKLSQGNFNNIDCYHIVKP